MPGSSAPDGNGRAATAFADKTGDLRRCQQAGEAQDALVLRQGLRRHEDIRVRIALGTLQRERIPSRVEPGLQGIIAIDDRHIDVVEGARQLRRGDFDKAEVSWVPGDVLHRCERPVSTRMEPDQSARLEELQPPAEIRDVVRQGDARLSRHRLEGLQAPGVDPEGLDMDGGDHREADPELRLFRAQVRHVLEEIRVGVTVAQEAVRADIAGGFDECQGKPWIERPFDELEDLRMRNRGGDHTEGRSGSGYAGGQRKRSG